MLIALDRLHSDTENARRVPAHADDDAALAASMQSEGLLQPILVRPAIKPDEWIIVAGERRVKAARALGWSEIEAQVRELSNGHVAAASAAENLVRAPLSDIDVWRAMVRLQERGYTLAHAAGALGISARHAQQLTKLGCLHPEILADLEAHGMQAFHWLKRIAAAPRDMQERALQAKGVRRNGKIDWYTLFTACNSRRIPRAHAIFDVETAGVAFEEDFFAEPGSPEQFTTTDIQGFMRAQEAALQARAEQAQKKKEAFAIGTWNQKSYSTDVPSGWVIEKTRRYTGKAPKASGDSMVLVAVKTDGAQMGEIEETVLVRKGKPKKEKPAPESKRQSAAANHAEGEHEAADSPAPQPAPARLISKKGLEILAEEKSAALHAALRQPGHPTETLLAAFVLAMGSLNIVVSGYPWDDHGGHRARPFADLAARLVRPDGSLEIPERGTLHEIAGEALARMLHIRADHEMEHSYPAGSGTPAEWIGAAFDADLHLPRFDTADFLQHCSAAQLKQIAESAGVKATGSATEIRKRLEGNAPNWHLCTFGAPGPADPRDEKADRQQLEECDAA